MIYFCMIILRIEKCGNFEYGSIIQGASYSEKLIPKIEWRELFSSFDFGTFDSDSLLSVPYYWLYLLEYEFRAHTFVAVFLPTDSIVINEYS